MTSLTGLTAGGSASGSGAAGASPTAGWTPDLEPWSKAGIIIKSSTTPGSAYAAMMVTGGHGVRMQWNYTGDSAGLGGAASRVTALAAPGPARRHDHRLRLRRRHQLDQGRHRHPGRPAGHRPGRAVRHVSQPQHNAQPVRHRPVRSRSSPPRTPAPSTTSPSAARWPAGAWTGSDVGDTNGPTGLDGFRQAGGGFTVSGSGDIAPVVSGQAAARRADRGRHQRRLVRGGDRGERPRRAVHHRRVPARSHPRHAGRVPAPRPGPRGQGHRDRRGHVRCRDRRDRDRAADRPGEAPRAAATRSCP